MAQEIPTPIRAQILLIAGELKRSGSPVHVARVQRLLSERFNVHVSHWSISKDLRRHGFELPGSGRPRVQPLAGFSVNA